MEPRQPTAPRCSTCGVEIFWQPAMHRGKTYCCGGCAQGGPCYCSYDLAAMDRELTPVPPAAGGRAPKPRSVMSGHRLGVPGREDV